MCVFMFWVPWCDVHYDFHVKTMFGSSLPSVVCRRAHVLFMLFVFVCASWCPRHIMFVCFVCFVLCTLCCQFLWIVHFWLPLQYSLMFINKPSSWKSLWQLSKEFLKKMKIKILKNKCTDNMLVPKKQQIWNTVLKIM
jgi:hypothetical protein